MRRSAVAAATGLVSVLALSGLAFAYEPGVPEPTKAGVSIGIPAGALPPPGLYVNNTFFVYNVDAVGPSGQKVGVRSDNAAYLAHLLWVPGWKFLGADYGAYVVQPFAIERATFEPMAPPCPLGSCTIRSLSGPHNTFFSPLNLSWNLGGGWFTSAGFGFYAPTGVIRDAECCLPPAAGTGGIGVDYWTFQPRWAISYLGGGWNLTANLYFEWNTENARSRYTSGNLLYGDLTATKKFGNWEIGPVAYFLTQTSADRDPLGLYPAAAFFDIGDRRTQQLAVGGLIGYDFGPAKLNLIVTDDLHSRSTAEGWMVMSNLSFRLWGPDARPPPK